MRPPDTQSPLQVEPKATNLWTVLITQGKKIQARRLTLIAKLTQPGINWEESFTEGLFAFDWSVGMHVEGCIN